jgi:hypothetical protein
VDVEVSSPCRDAVRPDRCGSETACSSVAAILAAILIVYVAKSEHATNRPVCDLLVADSVRGNGTEAGNHPASGIPSPGDGPGEQDDRQRLGQRPSPVAFAHPATGVWNRLTASSSVSVHPRWHSLTRRQVCRTTITSQPFNRRTSPVAFAHPATDVWKRAVSIAAMQARRYPSDARRNGILLAPQRFHRSDAARRYSSRPAIPGPWLHHPAVCVRWAIIRPVNRIRYRVASSPVARCARQVGNCPSPRQHSSQRGAVPLCRASWQAAGSGRPHFEPSAAGSPTGLCTALSSKRPHFEPFALNAMTGRCIAVPGKRRHFETEPQSDRLNVAATVYELPAWFVYLGSVWPQAADEVSLRCSP